jgi:NAD(P)-dependent dehydrogenase (short-subunit alcohol dehydrogenase family)
MTLTDRVVLFTGARRIGAVVAQQLATRGADVVLAYNRSKAEADQAVEEVHRLGRRAEAVRADIADPAGCRRLVDGVAASFGRLDVLINMASVYVHRDFAAMTDADWERALAVDLRGAFVCSHAAAPHMRRIGGGRIINFGDWVARSGRPRYKGYLAYYVAKAGVIALTEALALELAADNILVNAIAPGPIVAPPGTTDDELREVEASTPLGRWGGEIEIAKAVLALVDSDFITGETIRVDGGRHVK